MVHSAFIFPSDSFSEAPRLPSAGSVYAPDLPRPLLYTKNWRFHASILQSSDVLIN